LHPNYFSGLKKITGKKLCGTRHYQSHKNDIAIYAVHTALDNHQEGVNKIFSDALGLINTRILIPKEHFIRKLVTYTIPENAETVRNALFDAGQGTIGNYENCSFNSDGIGTYRETVVIQKWENDLSLCKLTRLKSVTLRSISKIKS
jgi:putative NIF3 family GTP cyclohydrolase 1 type 2